LHRLAGLDRGDCPASELPVSDMQEDRYVYGDKNRRSPNTSFAEAKAAAFERLGAFRYA